jgi:hypothetical protein
MISIGKLAGAGMPPAKEIIPGWETTLSISLIALAPIPLVLSANKCSKFMFNLSSPTAVFV